MKTIVYLFIILLFISTVKAQDDKSAYQADTSYTIYSAYKKLIDKYPFIKIVKAEVSDKINIKNNIVYKEINNRKLHLDIFEPKINNGKTVSAVLLIHGGGWRSGNKSMMHPLAIKIAENGFVAITAEYRLSGEAKYPAAVYDLSNAISWIKHNAGDCNIDTSKIVVLGCSAGGTLAALIGVTINNGLFKDSNENKINTNIAAIIDIDGILDFTHPSESGKDTVHEKPSAGKLWFGASFKDNSEKWIESSPVNYVDENSPPTLFINSSDERFHAGRDEFIEKLKSHNIYYEVQKIDNSPHTFWLFHPWFEETVNHIEEFLQRL